MTDRLPRGRWRRLRRSGAWVLALLLVAAGWYVAAARIGPPSPPWTAGAPMPTARSEMPAVVASGMVYVPGGLGGLGRTLATFEAYDPVVDAWQALPDLPEPRHHVGAAATDDLVVVTGGFAGLDFAVGRRDAWAFAIASGTWNQLPAMPGRRGAHASVVVDDVVYVIGGIGDDPSQVWSFDLRTGAWSVDHARLPTLREHAAAATLGGSIYVVGGRWPGVGNVAVAEVYDPRADTWTRLPDLPTARSGHRAAAVAGRLHVLGGEDLGRWRTFDEHEVFDPATGAWSAGPSLAAPRHGLAIAAVDGRLIVIGGASGAGALTVLSTTPSTHLLRVADGGAP